MATFVWAAAAGGNWSVGANWQVGGVAQSAPPTATDDVLIGSGTGATQQNITVDATAVCQSLDCTGYTKTFTMGASIALSIGSSTPGPGNVALKFVAGMTFASGNSSQFIFVSTSATAQTVNFAGPTNIDTQLRNIQFTGSGGNWQLTSAMNNSSAGGNVTHTRGTFDSNGQAMSITTFTSNSSLTRTLTFGSSAITITGTTSSAWSVTATGLTVTANTAIVTMTGANAGFFTGSGNFLNGLSLVFTGGGSPNINGPSASFTIANLTVTGTAAKTNTFAPTTITTASLVVTGAFVVNGQSAINRILMTAGTDGTAKNITAGSFTFNNVDFMDINNTGTTWTGTSMGDGGGNTGITFDAPATQTHTASAGGNWSDATKWTSRVPLPQDDVVVDVNTTGTLTADMPRLGKSIDLTGFTGTAAFNSTTNDIFGSLTLVPAMTFTHNQSLIFRGRSSFTITSAGKQFGNTVSFKAPGGTYTLLDPFVNSSSVNWFNGNFTTNSFNMTASTYSSNTVNYAKTFTFGSSTLTATSTGNVWDWFATNNTIVANTATVIFTNVSSTAKNMRGGLANYNGMSFTIKGGASNVFNWGNVNGTGTGIGTLTIEAPNTVTMFSGITTTLTNFVTTGSSGNVITINSSTAASPHTLSCKTANIRCYYLSIQDSTATGGASWYAYNSTNVSGNTGWIFNAGDGNQFNNYEFVSVGDGMSVGGDKIR